MFPTDIRDPIDNSINILSDYGIIDDDHAHVVNSVYYYFCNKFECTSGN